MQKRRTLEIRNEGVNKDQATVGHEPGEKELLWIPLRGFSSNRGAIVMIFARSSLSWRIYVREITAFAHTVYPSFVHSATPELTLSLGPLSAFLWMNFRAHTLTLSVFILSSLSLSLSLSL